MTTDAKIRLILSAVGVEQIEVLYPEGQRDQAWLLCGQLLPQLERLEQSLTEPAGERRDTETS
jgi:hypothetical protein